MNTTAPQFRAALRVVAEALPSGALVPVPREELLILLAEGDTPAPATATPEDRLLTANEVAERLGMSKEWVYKHAGNLPFARRIGSRSLRFSASGLDRWQSRRAR